jgi:hypothetical protein
MEYVHFLCGLSSSELISPTLQTIKVREMIVGAVSARRRRSPFSSEISELVPDQTESSSGVRRDMP